VTWGWGMGSRGGGCGRCERGGCRGAGRSKGGTLGENELLIWSADPMLKEEFVGRVPQV
jgi:hypothetical protein